MPPITKEETEMITGKIPSTPEKRYLIRLKLKAFQAAVTDPSHVARIDALIPTALANTKAIYAQHRVLYMRGGSTAGVWNRIYISEMNRLTREAGLR